MGVKVNVGVGVGVNSDNDIGFAAPTLQTPVVETILICVAAFGTTFDVYPVNNHAANIFVSNAVA